MELTTWFPGYPQSVSQIRRLLRQLASQRSLPADVADDLVLAGSEAAGYLVSHTSGRELKLKWISLHDGAEVQLEVDGVFPRSSPAPQSPDAFRLIDAVTNEARVVETLSGRPRTTFKFVRRLPAKAHARVA